MFDQLKNQLISKKHKKVWTILNYIEHFPIIAYTSNGCISIVAFASLIGIPIGITNSEIRLKTRAISAGYVSILHRSVVKF